MSAEDHEVRAVAEDASGGSSSSPSPGDTLPWNLGKTQRTRRGGGGSGGNGSVLDPAERAVIRIAGNAERPRLSDSDINPGLLTELLLRATCGRGERAGWSEGPGLWQVIAGSAAPPAGTVLSAAGGLRWRPPQGCHHWPRKEPGPGCPDTFLGSCGQSHLPGPLVCYRWRCVEAHRSGRGGAARLASVAAPRGDSGSCLGAGGWERPSRGP